MIKIKVKHKSGKVDCVKIPAEEFKIRIGKNKISIKYNEEILTIEGFNNEITKSSGKKD